MDSTKYGPIGNFKMQKITTNCKSDRVVTIYRMQLLKEWIFLNPFEDLEWVWDDVVYQALNQGNPNDLIELEIDHRDMPQPICIESMPRRYWNGDLVLERFALHSFTPAGVDFKYPFTLVFTVIYDN